MTAINLKNIIEIAQRKIAVVDSNSSTRDLENLMEITMLAGGGHKADSAGFDSDVSDYVGRVVFIDSGSEGFFKFNQTIAGAPSATPSQNFTQIVQGGTYTEGPTPATFSIQGASFGYVHGGMSTGSTYKNVIQKYSLTSTANATDVGDLTTPHWANTGGKGPTYGYDIYGRSPSTSPQYTTAIEYYPFASDTNAATATPTMRAGGMFGQGEAVGNGATVYKIGGRDNEGSNVMTNIIEKFPTASIAGSISDVGDLTTTRFKVAGSASETHGYAAGGNPPSSPSINNIEKVTFAVDGNGTDVGDLTVGRDNMAGISSPTHGYTAGGITTNVPGNSYTDTIDKFTFASDGNATDVGNLDFAQYFTRGVSSATTGYVNGGRNPLNPGPPASSDFTNTIQTFPFASDTNTSDHADLTFNYGQGGTTQN